ncbi:transglycosylase SLT domain-containing protein [Roseivivax sp. CAU 1761]
MTRMLLIGALCLAPLAAAATAPPQAMSLPLPAPGPAAISEAAVAVSPRPKMRDDRIPEARWGKGPRRVAWTRAAVRALRGPAARLTEIVPGDIDTWCPGYRANDSRLREAFWVGLVSSLARHESTWRPQVSGGGGRWHGLLQIAPATARAYGCRAQSGADLRDGPANLSCGLRIMARTVARDRVVSAGMRGVAADWGPFHSRAKREDMIAWSRAQPYCRPAVPALRPQARPDLPAAAPAAPALEVALAP